MRAERFKLTTEKLHIGGIDVEQDGTASSSLHAWQAQRNPRNIPRDCLPEAAHRLEIAFWTEAQRNPRNDPNSECEKDFVRSFMVSFFVFF